MLFNSFEFLLVLLPITLAGFYLLRTRVSESWMCVWLLCASWLFYGWHQPIYLILLIGSLLFNYWVSGLITHLHGSGRLSQKKICLIMAILANLALLIYFKYQRYFLITGISVSTMQSLTLPLGISFFTFQQIAYLVDIYEKRIPPQNILRYSLFISFFAQLVAGPIVRAGEFLPQLREKSFRVFQPRNFSLGLFLLAIGLCKKLVLADSFSVLADAGYTATHPLCAVEAWITTFAYTLQIYFDFSGYSDMAVGLGLLFNIRLPFNFTDPYRALSITEFWKRWHVTLSQFLRDYVYIPLGGNRKSKWLTLRNIFITFTLGAIWHGMGWAFIVWGLMHAVGVSIERAFSKRVCLPKVLSWSLTFGYVHIAWVFFRSADLNQALSILRSMIGLHGLSIRKYVLLDWLTLNPKLIMASELLYRIARPDIFIICLLLFIAVFTLSKQGAHNLVRTYEMNIKNAVICGTLLYLALIYINSIGDKAFIYYDF